MATYDALELQIIGQERPEYIRVPADASAEKVLEMFLTYTDQRWILVHTDDDEPKYVHSDRVASVTLRRGLDDNHVPVRRGARRDDTRVAAGASPLARILQSRLRHGSRDHRSGPR